METQRKDRADTTATPRFALRAPHYAMLSIGAALLVLAVGVRQGEMHAAKTPSPTVNAQTLALSILD